MISLNLCLHVRPKPLPFMFVVVENFDAWALTLIYEEVKAGVVVPCLDGPERLNVRRVDTDK